MTTYFTDASTSRFLLFGKHCEGHGFAAAAVVCLENLVFA
jgi:hypothetical protein